ncbi:hypothetical protein LTR53_007521, partial [Teratosphaeriaceae sp. CCFEE 6253]
NNRVWAARVQPADPSVRVFTENMTRYVVLATRRETKPIEAAGIHRWDPVHGEQALEFDTVVGEKVQLRIEEEVGGEERYDPAFLSGRQGKKHPRDEDFPPLGAQQGGKQAKPQQRGGPPYSQNGSWANKAGGGGGGGIGFSAQRGGGGGRGGRGGNQQRGFRGGRGNAGGGAGRGRGGRGAYRSLDDNPEQGGYGSGGMQY